MLFSGETAANLEPLQHNHIGKVHKGSVDEQLFRSILNISFHKKMKS
jgi:hypothetical protein